MQTKNITFCPFCQKKIFKLIGPVKITNPAYNPNSNLVECSYCSLIFINPLPNETKLSAMYMKNYHNNSHHIYNFVLWKLYIFEMISEFNLIKKYKKSGVIIDIGAGSGELLLRFPENDYERWIYEPFLSKKEVINLKKKFQHINDYKILTEYPSEIFDVVILRNVVEHTADFFPLIAQAYRILKKDGICYIRTPNMDSLDFRKFKNSWYMVNMDGHMVFYKKKVLTTILKKVGFAIKLLKPVKGSPPLSLFRSTTIQPSLFRMILSLGYCFISPYFGEGFDQQVIAQKR